ncbi:LPXTG cell wall anchor domain-containing protein [Leucobacter sp. NPDC015123]|uniref:LPXTG cell wall anchor domain-containing protein n=1 Tax=Leucobacter sp. NPDC015123 TaxID=3364129 RepID=UPI0036F48EC5
MSRALLKSAAVLSLGVAVSVLAPAAATATAGDGDLLVIDEQLITVEAPAPGDSSAWEFAVTNSTRESTEVFVRISRVEGALFEGPVPGEVAVGAAGQPVSLAGAPGVLLDAEFAQLAPLPARGELTVVGEVSLPRSAGNEYQGASGTFTVQLAATRDVGGGAGGGGMADTGAAGPWLWVAVGAAAVAAGGLLVSRRRVNSTEDRKGNS